MNEDTLLGYLTEIIRGLGESAGKLVIIGGFASFPYHQQKSMPTPLFTFDLDAAVFGRALSTPRQLTVSPKIS